MFKKILIFGIFATLTLLVTGCEREEPARPTTEPPAAPATPPPPAPPETTQVPPAPAEEEPAVAEQPPAETPTAAPPGEVPDQLTFEAKNGNVTFPHGAHAAMFDCSSCHEQTPPAPIPDWGRERAHELCIGCHKSEGAGPVQCNACHIRG